MCPTIGPCLELCLPALDSQDLCIFFCAIWGMLWHSWLRHCATTQKVVGSIPDGVIGIFH